MNISPRKLNAFLSFKLPSAFLCGVRATYIDDEQCKVRVKHRWINQNPFNSMFWVVQGMAAELTTGALVMSKIKDCGKPISMLVASNNATFSKKATGRINFICRDGLKVDEAIKKAIETGEGQTIWMNSVGSNEEGIEVSNFNFEWTLKLRGKKREAWSRKWVEVSGLDYRKNFLRSIHKCFFKILSYNLYPYRILLTL